MNRPIIFYLNIKMGCSESSTVMQKPPQMQVPTTKPKLQHAQNFLFGHVGQSQFLFAKVNLAHKFIDRISIPNNFQPCNFSSMLTLENRKFFITGGINFELTNITSDCYIYDSSAHSVNKLANMNQPRYTHAALLLQNQVYVVGGRYFGDDDIAILKSCQLYSIKNNEWRTLPDLNIKRCTCYAMGWGRQVYVFGGYTGKFQRSQKIQKLNLHANQWEILDFELNRGIQSAFIISMGSNQITIFGGNTNAGPTSSVSTINFQQRTIISHKNLSQPKMLQKSFIEGDQIMILGGSEKGNLQVYNMGLKKTETFQYNLNQQFSPDVFEVLSQSQKSLIVSKQKSNKNHRKINQGDDLILTFGTTEEPFVFQLNVSIPSSTILPVPLNLKLHSESGGVSIANEQFLIFGGIQDDSLSSVTTDTYLYNHQTRLSKKLAPLLTPRYAFAFQMINKRVYAIGGGNCDSEGNLIILKEGQYFDLSQYNWNSICDLPIPLISSMSLDFKDSLYTFGGMTLNSKRNKAIFRYKETQNDWTELKFHLPYGLEAGSIYQFKSNEFYIFGGRAQNGDIDTISSLVFTQIEQVQCAFFQKAAMSEKKCGVKVFRPQKQDFIVCLGGTNELVSYYDVQSLKQMQWDGLKRLKQVFLVQLENLNFPKMKNYLTISNYSLSK